MSLLSRFMQTARSILDTPDDKRVAPNPHQPPIVVRTNFLFVEIDEALTKGTVIADRIKRARLNNDVTRMRDLNKELGTLLRQAGQLAVWAEEHFQRDYGDAD